MQQLTRPLLVAAMALCGCNFRIDAISLGGDAGADGDLAAGANDLAVTSDLATTPPPGSDLAGRDMVVVPMSCTVGARVCADATHAAECQSDPAGPKAVVDRACPPSSMCSAGHCAPPAGAATCTRGADCSASTVCTLYVVGAVTAGYCTAPIPGGKSMFGSCGAPYGVDPSCKTGVCAVDASDSSKHQCLFPCLGQNDCGGADCVSVDASVLVEGTTAGAFHFCVN